MGALCTIRPVLHSRTMGAAAFISHASEDKHTVAVPLAAGLRAAGMAVWLDAERLQLGDSLRSRMDRALSECQFGVVVLSPDYLRKEWPARELDALLSLEEHHGKRLLPVWHNIDGATLAERSPLMAARLAVSTSAGIDHVVREIARAWGRPEAITEASPSPRFERPESLIGLTISSYTLEKFVGGGGSGLVFRVNHPQQGSTLALKVFLPLRPAVSHLTHLFERGFHAVKAVNHPDVARVVDYGTCVIDARSTAFLVTRFVDGIALDKWRRTRDGTTLSQRLRVAYSLTDGLATCHATTFRDEVGIQVTGVHHGDIKPANILVDTHNTPFLIDFRQIDVQRDRRFHGRRSGTLRSHHAGDRYLQPRRNVCAPVPFAGH
jgi:hypothetical protein